MPYNSLAELDAEIKRVEGLAERPTFMYRYMSTLRLEQLKRRRLKFTWPKIYALRLKVARVVNDLAYWIAP